MRKLRILVLVVEGLVPPESVEGFDLAAVEWKTEYDVKTGLQDLGHDVRVVGVYDSLAVIRQAIEEFEPHVVFMLLEEFLGTATLRHSVVGYLELMQVSFTGCNSRGLMLAKDKALSKKVLRYHRIPVPHFVTCRKGHLPKLTRNLAFPVIVKSLWEDASLGIAQASVVTTEEELRERTLFIHEKVGTDAIIEQYIEGREFYVGVLGNSRLTAFPVWELDFGTMTDSGIAIATSHVKWNEDYRKKHGIRSGRAADLSPDAERAIQNLSKRIYRRLDLSGYARLDFRYTEDGRAYLIEANPNPGIAYGEEFPDAAERVGLGYEKVLQRIVTLGMSWHDRRR